MKIRVTYTVNVTDDYRRAIAKYHGKPGLASRTDVQLWLYLHGISMDDDLEFLIDEDEQ